MALDGIVISNIVNELNSSLVDGRLYKIAQPEADELLLTIKNNGTQYRLTISANAGLPLIYLTDVNKTSPITAPNFCMLLRKHVNNGRILRISQPGLERVIDFELEHLNEMGDLCKKHLIVELMGKHSNIIFCDDKNMIIDSIKHVSSQMSSVREVLPGREYFIPQTTDKANPLEVDYKTFAALVYSKPIPLVKAIYTSITGLSPIISEELCYEASIDSSTPANVLNENEQKHLFNIFKVLIETVISKQYVPNIVYKGNEPIEFGSLELSIYNDTDSKESKKAGGSLACVKYSTISEVLHTFYATKNAISRIRQRSVDLRRILNTALERNYKKYDLQLKQLKDTDKRDKFKVYGELINTYGYGIESGSKSFEALNYYTNEMITIPLDTLLSPKENAVRYFDKYNKLKRTFEADTKIVEETSSEINHLESISTSLDIALAEEDLVQLKEELIEFGYIKRKGPTGKKGLIGKKGYVGKKVKITSKPFHYISSDGFHIYVGKNNFQNDELTFKFANGGDWWFHAKTIPGSHVIVKAEGNELTDKTYEEAASLAAHYSKGRDQEKVEIDYTERKNLKKPNAAKPGFVIYNTNFSMVANTDISKLTIIQD